MRFQYTPMIEKIGNSIFITTKCINEGLKNSTRKKITPDLRGF